MKPAPLLFTALGNSVLELRLQSAHCYTLPAMIYAYAVSAYDDWHRQAWAAGFILLSLVLTINIIARLVVSRGIHMPRGA